MAAKKPYKLKITLEEQQRNNRSVICEEVELGEFRTQEEGQDELDDVLEQAGFDVEDDENPDDEEDD